MASRDFRELALARSRRAEELAHRFPAAENVLDFYGRLSEFQAEIWHRTHQFDQLPALLDDVAEFVRQNGTPLLQQAADYLDQRSFQQILLDYWHRIDTTSVNSLFARIVLQPYASSVKVDSVDAGENVCPRCGHLPQVGVLYPLGHGNELKLVCSLCLHEWTFPRVCCSSCMITDKNQLEFHQADSMDYLQSQSCSACFHYLLLVDQGKMPQAIAFVDEMAALPLDVWNRKRGFEKPQLNFAGI